MPSEVRRCGSHGFFEGESCPACDSPGERLFDGARRERLSRFVSGALRHFPADAGIDLDDAGWADLDALASAVEGRYDWATETHLLAVIATDPKGRFERDGGRVRAAYGHSVAVELGNVDAFVPDTLYHGTAPENVDSILEEGLRAMGRQAVHLSGTVEDAREVGERHADEAVIFAVDAAGMRGDGHEIAKRGKGTYTTGRVPPEYLSVSEC